MANKFLSTRFYESVVFTDEILYPVNGIFHFKGAGQLIYAQLMECFVARDLSKAGIYSIRLYSTAIRRFM